MAQNQIVRVGNQLYTTAELRRERQRKARLSRAAPDLLALVRDIRNLDHVRLAHGDEALLEDLRKWKAEARAAIAKAEGGS